MSRQTVEFLASFESLPEEEKRVFTAAFLRRAAPYDSGPYEDNEVSRAADDIFAMLDMEEGSRT